MMQIQDIVSHLASSLSIRHKLMAELLHSSANSAKLEEPQREKNAHGICPRIAFAPALIACCTSKHARLGN